MVELNIIRKYAENKDNPKLLELLIEWINSKD